MISHFLFDMKAWPHPIQAVIFDNDGTVLDSIKLYAEVNSRMIGEPFPKKYQYMINGLNEHDEAKKLIELFHLKYTPEEYNILRKPLMEDILGRGDLVPGAEAFVRKLKAMKIPIALATSSKRTVYELKTQNHRDFYNIFDVIICGDEVTEAKPSPQVFQKAAAKLGSYKPENILVFEDASNGVKAANLAGDPCVMLTASEGEGANDGLRLMNAHADIMIENFSEFDFNSFVWQPIE